jgi:hypothetical protein
MGAMIDAVQRIPEIDRRACRERVERLFSPKAMADGYESVYTALIGQREALSDALVAVSDEPPAMSDGL